MRKKIVAGNWKMNTTKPDGVELAKAVAEGASKVPAGVGLIVAPPFTHLCAVGKALAGSGVELSAQNCADHEKGAYTGEVSVDMLKAVGDVRFILLASFSSMWLCRVGGAYLVVRFFGMGVEGIWYAMYLDWAFRGILYSVRVLHGRWVDKKVI